MQLGVPESASRALEPSRPPAVARLLGTDDAPKRYLHGAHRAALPEETLARIQPHLGRAGITRIANVTGLDRIGLPVAIAIRPNSPTLTTSAGKGLTLAAARASAAMEALEFFHAEQVRLPVLYGSYDQISRAHAAIPPSELPLSKHAVWPAHAPERWVLGWDLLRQEEVAAPRALVALTPASPQARTEWWPFQSGTNGLASGNHLLEALASALLELIERDAVTCHQLAWERGVRPLPRVAPEQLPFPLAQEVLAKLAAADVMPLLFDCALDTEVPVYLAFLYDRRERANGMFRGAGAHLDPEVAVVRALTEAAQARAVYLAGSRDDLLRRGLLGLQLHDDAAAVRTLNALPCSERVARPSEATPTFGGDVQVLLGKLRRAGLQRAIAFDLTLPEIGIPVVRALVPGLEGALFAHYAPGRRALAYSAAAAGRG